MSSIYNNSSFFFLTREEFYVLVYNLILSRITKKKKTLSNLILYKLKLLNIIHIQASPSSSISNREVFVLWPAATKSTPPSQSSLARTHWTRGPIGGCESSQNPAISQPNRHVGNARTENPASGITGVGGCKIGGQECVRRMRAHLGERHASW